jgi:rare lipoprotein A
VQVTAMPPPPVVSPTTSPVAPVAPPPPVRQASWSPQELAQTNGVDADVGDAPRLAAPPSTLGNQAAVLSGGRHAYTPTVAAQPPAANPRLAAPASRGQGGLYVQAGAFSQLESAERVRVQLAHFGNALVTPVQANGRELYRVRLGPVSDARAADSLRQQMLRSGYRDARVVND